MHRQKIAPTVEAINTWRAREKKFNADGSQKFATEYASYGVNIWTKGSRVRCIVHAVKIDGATVAYDTIRGEGSSNGSRVTRIVPADIVRAEGWIVGEDTDPDALAAPPQPTHVPRIKRQCLSANCDGRPRSGQDFCPSHLSGRGGVYKGGLPPTRASDNTEAEKIPPCAAFMGCLCVGHACGNDPDAACDTNEDNYRDGAPVIPIRPRRPRAVIAPRYRPESKTPSSNQRLGPALMNSQAVALALRDIATADREHFVVFDLNVRHRMIERRVVHIGSLTGVDCHPREVFKGAILNSAAAVIIAHNHPSGDVTPSRTDVELTQRLREAGEILGIPVIDHVIVGGDGYSSFAERAWK